MDTGISAIQHLRPLRGGAQARLLKAYDGSCYVPNADFHLSDGVGGLVAEALDGMAI